MTIKADLRHVIYALSDALDLVGVDDVGHGKLRVPDDILDKPGKLDDRERRTINTQLRELPDPAPHQGIRGDRVRGPGRLLRRRGHGHRNGWKLG